MNEDLPRVVLDACVLANYSVCDLFLRLAEEPETYRPIWSAEILAETTRTLEDKLGWPRPLVSHFESQLRTNFPQAMVENYERWVAKMTNDQKDRHVAAVAVESHASIIVTFNLRHFKPADLAPWYVTAIHPEQFLIDLLKLHPHIVRVKLDQQAARRNRSLPNLLGTLRLSVPKFVELLKS